MINKTGFLSRIILFFLCVAFFHIFPGYSFERKQPLPIPPHFTLKPLSSLESDANFCTIQYDIDSVKLYFDKFKAGDGIAVYMDPEDCGSDTNIYPFKITNVYFYLYDPDVFIWPANIKVNIRDVYSNGDTLKPDWVRNFESFTIPADSAYDSVAHQSPINLTLDEVFCVDSPFFLEIVYTEGVEGQIPSLVMSDSADDRPEPYRNWLFWNGDYVEWYDFWYPWAVPGRAIIRVTGYPYAIDCNLCWDWMPKATQAPNGMPDFDQYQFGDTSAFCGPTAVANCLVWLDAISSIQNPDSLIRLLSDYFHTDPDSGTLVDSITTGLDSLFLEHSLNLYSTQLLKPTYSDIVDSLINSANTVLLVGLWQNIDETWYRIGGHYVSVAGACEESLWTALSDPAADNAEKEGRGRFLPPHDPHPEDHILHNTKGFVSHDAYVSDTLFVPPYADTLWRLKDYYDGDLPWSQFEGQNFQPEQEQYRHDYDSAESLYAVVEYAVMIFEKSTLVEEEEGETPTYFELYQSFPNPFNNHTIIKYSLLKPTNVSLVIYNILGQKVRTLVRKERQSGLKTVIWDGKDDRGRDLSSGIYLYQLQAGKITQTRRMVLLK